MKERERGGMMRNKVIKTKKCLLLKCLTGVDNLKAEGSIGAAHKSKWRRRTGKSCFRASTITKQQEKSTGPSWIYGEVGCVINKNGETDLGVRTTDDLGQNAHQIDAGSWVNSRDSDSSGQRQTSEGAGSCNGSVAHLHFLAENANIWSAAVVAPTGISPLLI